VDRRERNKAEKRRRLEAAGIQAFLADGFTAASVERIAAEADVARGTFYLYHHDKEALFKALMERLWEPLIDAVEHARDALARCPDTASTLPVYAALGLELAGLLGARRAELQLYFAEARARGPAGDMVRRRAARLEELTREILEDAVKKGTLRPHDVRAVSLAIFGGIERLVYGFLEQPGSMDPTTVPVEVIRLFRHGLAPAA
jgi:AcrR family transcriptional regulator